LLFNSVSYLAFLFLAVTIFWALPVRNRLTLLLIASLVFYALWRIEFVLLIAFSAFVDYYFSLKIAGTERADRRLVYVVLSLTTNIGLLIYFKYTYFILDNAAFLLGVPGANLKSAVGNIVLPLGISFYTFLSISYTIDVYRKDFKPIRNFKTYLTYVMFWPHMIAGPILRAHELIPQLVDQNVLNVQDIVFGVRNILFGLFLKVVLADQIAPLVDDAFLIPATQLGGVDVWTMAFAFGFQIYFDFAGYSMIAIGSARLMGVRFPENFDWPYLATSPREFWRRWHITLSSWIRDYLYLPLTGLKSRNQSKGGIEFQVARSKTVVRGALALLLTWFVMGLWHGANWNFAFWGIWHAAFILLYRLTFPYLHGFQGTVSKAVGWGITLGVVMLGWIPFRSPSMTYTISAYSRLFDLSSYSSLAFRENLYLAVFLFMCGMLSLRWITTTRLILPNNVRAKEIGEIASLAVAIFFVFIFLRPTNQFIYFQF